LRREETRPPGNWFQQTSLTCLWNTGEVYTVELYARVRRAVIVDKMSEREAARMFGLARETVRKMLGYSVPPGYRRQQPVRRPKLGAWIGTINQILEDDKAEPGSRSPCYFCAPALYPKAQSGSMN